MLGLAPLGAPISALSGTVYSVSFFSNGYGSNAYGVGKYSRSGVDDQVGAISASSAVSESVTSSDAPSTRVDFGLLQNESATLSDAPSTMVDFVGLQNESATSSEVLNVQTISYVDVIEIDAVAVDDLSPEKSIYANYLLEIISPIDTLSARLLWEPESDTAESWDPESDTSSIWVNSSDNSYTWTNIDDTPDTWTPVAGGSTTWTPI